QDSGAGQGRRLCQGIGRDVGQQVGTASERASHPAVGADEDGEMGLRQAAILLLVAAAAGLIIGWIWNGALWGERYAELERDHAQHIAAQQAASADVISRTLLRERDLHNQFEEYE